MRVKPSGPKMTADPTDAEIEADDLRRIGFLARETRRDWTQRFLRERGLPELSDAEMTEFLALDPVRIGRR